MRRFLGYLLVGFAAVGVLCVASIVVYEAVKPAPALEQRQESDHEHLAKPRSTANPSATGRCGIELWKIKTLTDARAGQVDLAQRFSSIAYLDSRKPPAQARNRPRYLGSIEMGTWRISATLTGFALEADSDLHLVLADAQGRTLIAEIPDPACAQGSPVLPQIEQARAAFTATYNPTDGCFGCLSDRVVLTGVGFFDKLHGQTGVAPNGAELHPVLSFRRSG